MKSLMLLLSVALAFSACSQQVTTEPEATSSQFGPSLSFSTLASCSVPTAGLLSWWPGDGNANDVQGGHHATMDNGATFAPGILGQAFSLDGVDDWVRIGDNGAPTTTQFTVAAWVWIDGTGSQPAGSYRTIYADNSDGFWIYNPDIIEPGGEGFRINWWDSGINSLVTDTDIPVGEWKHLTQTYDGSTFKGYLDGVLDGVGSRVGQQLPNGVGLGIGRKGASPEQFKGLIDEVRVYDRALSAIEVSAFACVSSLDQVDAMSGEVADLVASGVLDEGNGNALQATLETVTKAINNDRPNVPNLLNAFINKVEGFVSGGILSPADGQVLLDAAQALIDQLGS